MEQEKLIQELQQIENNLQHYISQKQSLQSQLLEINSAIHELTDDKDSYRIIGNIMVKTEPQKLREIVLNKKNVIELRLQKIKEHEEMLKKRAEEIQKKIKGD